MVLAPIESSDKRFKLPSARTSVLVEVADALHVWAGKSLIRLVNVVGERGFESPAPASRNQVLDAKRLI